MCSYISKWLNAFNRPNVHGLGQTTHRERPIILSKSKLGYFRHLLTLLEEFVEISRVWDEIAHSENEERILRSCWRLRSANLSTWACNSTSINYHKPRVLSEEPQIQGSSKIASPSSSPLFSTCPFHQESQYSRTDSSASVPGAFQQCRVMNHGAVMS